MHTHEILPNRRLHRAAMIAAATFLAASYANAADTKMADRSGKEVVETVCVGCHETGKDGAPKIGDRAEWAKRGSHGLENLTSHAITGIRKMPAHGGQASLTDLEMSRAVAYMISGGKAVDPSKPYAAPKRLSGAQIVKARCSECHAEGKEGAPRIGNAEDWKPRLAGGVDALVKSAIRGHNAMQARAGMDGLSDAEMRSAVETMVVQIRSAAKAK